MMLLEQRVQELERELEDYKVGRRYTGGGDFERTGFILPIDLHSRYVNAVATALRITPEEWRSGWDAVKEIERLRAGERE